MKKVYIEVDPSLYTVGKNTFMDEMLTMINAENIVKEEGWPQLNQEAIIEAIQMLLLPHMDFIQKMRLNKY